LYSLGKLGGLLPKSQPKSDHLHKVISLAAGLTCVDVPFEVTKVTVNGKTENQLLSNDETSTETPISKLKNALSSKEQFEQHYLELCELAMGTYKHIGRIRSARKVGLSLASYYIECEEYFKAIGFLTDAFKTFRDDKWDLLVVDVLLKLAQCYQITDDYDKYIRTCAQLACCKTLSDDRRHHFFDEMMNSLSNAQNSDRHILSTMEDTFKLNSLKIETPGKINLNSCPVTVTIELASDLPKPTFSSSIQLAILLCDSDHEKHLQSFTLQNGIPNSTNPGNKNRPGGAGSAQNSQMNNPGKEDLNAALMESSYSILRLEIGQQLDMKQDKTINGGRLMCHNSHQALRRKDSQMKVGDLQVLKTDFSMAAKIKDVIINPGANVIVLKANVTSPGQYRLSQMSIEIKHFELVSPRMGCRYKFLVEKTPGKIGISSDGDHLNMIAGIEQPISLKLFTGSNSINEGALLSIRSSMGLLLKTTVDSPLSSEVQILLPRTESFSHTVVQLIVKAQLGPQKDNSAIEHKLITRCPWSNEETKLPVIFIPPFMSSHRLNTVGQRKFLQVSLQGLCNSKFSLLSHQLTAQHQNSQDIPLVPLNPRSQELTLSTGQNASYMWEIGTNDIKDDNPLRLEFSITFQSMATSKEVTHSNVDNSHQEKTYLELYKYYVCLQRFKTQYEIKSRVEPHKGSEFCRVGNMCSMIIDIDKYKEPAHASLMYEVRADQHMWAICGRTSGVVSMDGCDSQQMTIDVMPMSPGFLPLPTVHLSKYIPADQKGGNSSVPKLEPFSSGQIFNKSRGAQMHVLPPPQTSCSTQSSGNNSSVGMITPSPLIPSEHY
ncbi:unnamed protein product, partial [Allacma fusca]